MFIVNLLDYCSYGPVYRHRISPSLESRMSVSAGGQLRMTFFPQ